MAYLKLAFCSLTLIGLASCGGGGSDDIDSNIADFQGNWVSACAPVADGDSERQEWTVTGNNITQSTVTYLTQGDCSGTLTISRNLPGTFVVDGTTTEVSEGLAKNIDITYSAGNVSASTLTTNLLESQGTTLADLLAAEGVADINNLPLAVFGRSQPELFSIYRVAGDELRIGSISGSSDGTTPALRSTRLSTSITFTRQ